MFWIRIVCICWVNVGAFAATVTATGQELTGGTSDSTVLADEIVVTALRTPQNPNALAVSVTALKSDTPVSLMPVHPAERLNDVAGVNIQRGSGQEHLTAIRSPVLTGGAGAGSFLYLEDGVPMRAAGFANVNGLFEAATEVAETLEVLKGPGSVVYGSNAVHGLINVISRPVEGDDFARMMISDAGQMSTQASVATGSTRISGSFVHDNGFREASGFDQQKIQLRHQSRIGGWDASGLTTYQNLNQETAGFVQGPKAYRDDNVRFTNPNPEAYRDVKSFRTQWRFDRPAGEGLTLSVTPYARWTEIEFLRHFIPGQAREENAHTSVGILSTLYGDDFVIGVDAEVTRGYLYEFQDNPTVFSYVEGAHYDYAVTSGVAAVYGQKRFDLGTRTTLAIGARGEYTHYDYDNHIDSGVFGRILRIDDRADDFFTITPKVGVTHALSDTTTLFGRLARGARAPQTSDLYSVQINQDPAGAKVETLDSVEGGVRANIQGFDVEITAYAMHKENFFFRNANGFNVVDGQTNHRGVEMSWDGNISPWLRLNGDIAWAKHTYDFTDIVSSASSSITKGDDVDTAPRLTARVNATAHLTPMLDVSLDWRFMGEYTLDPGNTQDYPGHSVVVFRTDWRVTDRVSTFARVDNVMDVKYADRADFAFGNERYFPGRPRTFFWGLTSRF